MRSSAFLLAAAVTACGADLPGDDLPIDGWHRVEHVMLENTVDETAEIGPDSYSVQMAYVLDHTSDGSGREIEISLWPGQTLARDPWTGQTWATYDRTTWLWLESWVIVGEVWPERFAAIATVDIYAGDGHLGTVKWIMQADRVP